MKSFILSLAMLLSITTEDTLTGRWESKPSEKGNITGVVFKADNSFEGYVNKKPFASGTFIFNPTDSLFSIVDNGCDGMRGMYKIMFYSNSDSFRFQPISDPCDGRKNGLLQLVMGRVK